MKKKFLTKDVDTYSSLINLLGYEEVSRSNSLFKNYTNVNYEKKESTLSEEKIRLYMPKSTIPFFFVVFFLCLAFLLITVFLILFFSMKPNFDTLKFFYILMLPAFISLICGSAISIVRYFRTVNNIKCAANIMLIKKDKDQDGRK